MTYIDAFRRGNDIYVSERREDGVRVARKAPAPFYFYVEDEQGKFKSMFGQKLKRVSSPTYHKHSLTISDYQDSGFTTFESDIKPEYRFLEDNFVGSVPPKLNIAVLDIESDRDRDIGFSRVDFPYAIINAITVDCKWLNEAVTICVRPPTMTLEEAIEETNGIENTFIVETEAELLKMTLDLLDDADVITGWNSEFYDIPMIIQRIRIVLGGEDLDDVANLDDYNPPEQSREHLSRLCLFDEIPTPRKVERWGGEEWCFALKGKVHLDYLELYMKFSFNELHSYALDYVLEVEIGEKKVAYDGSLDDLWRYDFRLFTEYNRQDTVGLSKVDDRRKFINLANQMAHTACVLLKDTLGSVTIIEHAILCELHKQKKVAPDKGQSEKEGKVAGAFVKLPVGGMYEWITSFDINSLYPSVIRMLNISPETVVGQFNLDRTMTKIDNLLETKQVKTVTEAWHHFTGVLEYHDVQEGNSFEDLTLMLEDGENITMDGEEWKEWFRETNCSITANGTVFHQDNQGIIPYCLEKWYNERVEFKKKSKEFDKEGNKELAEYWDTIQQARKLFLNSTYGALLNEWFRFYDTRFGQSVTLSGRVVTKHMIRKASELIDGKYEFGESAIYSDTDSVYMTMKKIINEEMSLTDIVLIADEIGNLINESYPDKMMESFFVPRKNGEIIQSGREVVAQRGIFKHETKKKYALFVVDDEGKNVEKLKIMGMETQRSDTPKWIQEFLHECLTMVVQEGKPEPDLVEKIIGFRTLFYDRDPWTLGSPKRLKDMQRTMKDLTMYNNNLAAEKPRVYYTVQASMNFNEYLEFFDDKDVPPIRDGDKIEIIYLNEKDLTNNPKGFKNIAIPVGLNVKSEWIKNLPLNVNRAYDSLVTKKLNNIFGVFNWELEPPDTTANEVFDW
jgi:DNA polymerase elongation subunit (family B)